MIYENDKITPQTTPTSSDLKEY